MKILTKCVLINICMISSFSYADNISQINIQESREPVVFSIDNYNAISFISFPKNLMGNFNFTNTSIGNFYPGGVNSANCAAVEARARNAVNPIFPDSMRNEQKNLVRKYSVVSVNLNSGVTFKTNAFRRKVLDKAAEVMRQDISKFDLDNSFQIDKITYVIDYETNSITNIIGNKDELKPQTDKMLSQLLFNTGSTTSELAASDLICDLYSGKAKIKMVFSGKYGKQTSVSYLLEKSEIDAVYLNMLSHFNEYLDASLANAKNKNLVLSTLFLKESLDKINKFSIDNKTFLSIYEQIISQENGRVIPNLDSQTLLKKMEVQEDKQFGYIGTVAFEYK